MRKVGILTSGGDAQGMNMCLQFLVNILGENGYETFGFYGGYLGIYENKYIKFESHSLDGIQDKGGTILKSARFEEFKKEEVQKVCANHLKDLGIDILVVLGGDGTFKGAKAISKFGIDVIGIPCTIDNDLFYTDFTIGYKTAVQVCINAIGNLKDTMESHERVCIVETMGRNCGYIALESGVVSDCKYIIIPEKEFSVKEIANRIKEDKNGGIGSDMICFAEGAMDSSEFQKELEKELGYSIKRNVLGHIQRGGAPVVFDKMLAIRLGNKVFKLIENNEFGKVVGIQDNHIIAINIDDIPTYKKHHNVYYDELMELAYRKRG